MMKKDKIAADLRKIAKELIAYDGDAEALKIGTKLDDLHDQFEKALGERVKIYNDALAVFEAAEKEMKEAYASFKKTTGWDKAMKSCEEEIAVYEKAGGDIGKIQSKFKIASSKSKQPSYKEWLELVATTFNNAEFKKYMNLLANFKKNSVTLSNNLKMADTSFKEWDDEMKKLYEERGLALPKASVKTAGIKDIVKDIAKFVGNIFGKIGKAFATLIGAFDKSASDMQAESKKVAKLL